MASADLLSIISGFLKLVLLAASVLYAGLVVVSYRRTGPKYVHRPIFVTRHMRPSVGPCGWGVMVLTLAVRMATPIFEMLSEASAEVGEWVLSRRHHEAS